MVHLVPRNQKDETRRRAWCGRLLDGPNIRGTFALKETGCLACKKKILRADAEAATKRIHGEEIAMPIPGASPTHLMLPGDRSTQDKIPVMCGRFVSVRDAAGLNEIGAVDCKACLTVAAKAKTRKFTTTQR